MRMLIKVTIPTAEGNAAVLDGTLSQTLGGILAELKPEAAYFAEDNGQRTGFIFVNVAEPSQIPAFAEPFFLSFNAKVEFHPAMNVEDLKAAGPALQSAAQKYGRATRAASA